MCFRGRGIIIIDIEGKVMLMDGNERNGEEWDYRMMRVGRV